MHERQLARMPDSVKGVIAQMIASGEIVVPPLRQVARQTEQTERVYQRPHETVFETKTKTTEIFFFG